MPYVTRADILAQLRVDTILALVDDEESGVLDLDGNPAQAIRVDASISHAISEADGYMGMAYRLPLLSFPSVVTAKVVDIAVYNLFSRRGLDQGSADINIRQRYQDAIHWLIQISNGSIRLPPPVEESPEVVPPKEVTAFSIVTKPRRGWGQ